MNDSSPEVPEVIVVGGGPAGATAATVLAMHGRRVLVLEKDRFPRYHVGESLMPHCYFTLERLGVLPAIQASHFPKKYSVQFVRMTGEVSTPFYFFQRHDHPSSTTWQVVRSEFDQLLLQNAREKGAQVEEGVTVRDLLTDDRGDVVGVRAVDAEGREREIRAQVTIDATGRDALAPSRLGWRVRDERLNKVAIWTYYKGAMRDPGLDAGATTVAYLPDKGWFWYIPLPGDVVSVGLVAERDYLFRDGRDPAAILQREIDVNEWVARHLRGARVVEPYRVTGEFTWRSRHAAANGLVLVGDAFGFLDPIFSSGVFLALKSGELAADAVHAALADGDVRGARFAPYAETMSRGSETMRKLVYAFYEHSFSWRKVLMRDPAMQGQITDCLIGDLFRDPEEYRRLFDIVGEFARLPVPFAHGRPLGG